MFAHFTTFRRRRIKPQPRSHDTQPLWSISTAGWLAQPLIRDLSLTSQYDIGCSKHRQEGENCDRQTDWLTDRQTGRQGERGETDRQRDNESEGEAGVLRQSLWWWKEKQRRKHLGARPSIIHVKWLIMVQPYACLLLVLFITADYKAI